MGREGGGGRAMEPPPAMVPGQPRPNSITETAEHIPQASQPASQQPPHLSPGFPWPQPCPCRLTLSSTLHTLASLIPSTLLGLPLLQLRKLRHREVEAHTQGHSWGSAEPGWHPGPEPAQQPPHGDHRAPGAEGVGPTTGSLAPSTVTPT